MIFQTVKDTFSFVETLLKIPISFEGLSISFFGLFVFVLCAFVVILILCAILR